MSEPLTKYEELDTGDLVEITKDYFGPQGQIFQKKGNFAFVECCGEELGGIENIRLLVKAKDVKRLYEFLDEYELI